MKIKTYVISGVIDPFDGEPLFWSNEDGWGSLETADTFTEKIGSLPIEGKWEEYYDSAIR